MLLESIVIELCTNEYPFIKVRMYAQCCVNVVGFFFPFALKMYDTKSIKDLLQQLPQSDRGLGNSSVLVQFSS